MDVLQGRHLARRKLPPAARRGTGAATSSCRWRRRRLLVLQPHFFICWNQSPESCNHFSSVLDQDGVELVFCWNWQVFLLEPARFFVARTCERFCCDRWARLVFAAIMGFIFAGTNVNFCWNRLIPFGTSNLFFLEFLLQLAVIFATTFF